MGLAINVVMAEIRLNAVTKSYDGRTHAVERLDLVCRQGEMLALLGPSGCGKSSTLKMVAGIESVTAGTITFDGVDVTRRDSAGRNVAMVFEDYALYPHLSVFENIAFPLRVRAASSATIASKVDQAIALLELGAFRNRQVRTLSGGAQQRVSIGRALVREPALVMFDEPLSHLDADQKVLLRTEIRRLQATAVLTSVLVTHDQTEAMAMADRIAVMDQGVLQQVGSPRDLYEAPANLFVAGFIGESPMNLFDTMPAPDGSIRLADAPELRLPEPPTGARPGAWPPGWVLGVRPEDITLSPREEEPAFALRGTVVDCECCGDRDVLRVRHGDRHFNVEQAAPSPARVGDMVDCHLPWSRLHGFDRATGRSLHLRGAAC